MVDAMERLRFVEPKLILLLLMLLLMMLFIVSACEVEALLLCGGGHTLPSSELYSSCVPYSLMSWSSAARTAGFCGGFVMPLGGALEYFFTDSIGCTVQPNQ